MRKYKIWFGFGAGSLRRPEDQETLTLKKRLKINVALHLWKISLEVLFR